MNKLREKYLKAKADREYWMKPVGSYEHWLEQQLGEK